MASDSPASALAAFISEVLTLRASGERVTLREGNSFAEVDLGGAHLFAPLLIPRAVMNWGVAHTRRADSESELLGAFLMMSEEEARSLDLAAGFSWSPARDAEAFRLAFTGDGAVEATPAEAGEALAPGERRGVVLCLAYPPSEESPLREAEAVLEGALAVWRVEAALRHIDVKEGDDGNRGLHGTGALPA